MNAGFLSFIVINMMIVLHLTGWKEMIIGKRSEDAIISGKSIFLFFVVWLLGLSFNLPIHQMLWINGAFLPVFLIACYGMWSSGSLYNALHIGTIAMLVGAMDVFYKQLLRIEPQWIIHSTVVDVSILLAILIVGLSKGFFGQFASITFGLSVGYALFALLSEAQPPLVLGSLRFFDQWWLVLLLSRIASFLTWHLRKVWTIVRN